MNREQIITSMCYTWRHDFGITSESADNGIGILSSGMTLAQQKSLWASMAQIFDNDIQPNMEFKNGT